MLYADKLYREYPNQPSTGNYSLNLDESTCKPVAVIVDNKNVTAAMYVSQKKTSPMNVLFVFSLDLVWDNEKKDVVKMT